MTGIGTQIKNALGWFLTRLKGNVVNNLTSTSTDLPLSAAKGKDLQDQITSLNTNLFNPTFVNVKNLNEENVDLTNWGYVTYSIIGCIVVVSFFIVSKKEFEYWHDYEICNLPPYILPKNQGNSPLPNLCVGTCYIQNDNHLSVGCPLIQLNNNSNGTATMYIRALASTFNKAESFRGSFVYLTYI